MNKLKSAVLYECSTKIKPMGFFYLAQYLCVALMFTILAICTNENGIGSNCLEFASVIFLSFIGVISYKEDFKALIQNGYTRKYIFLSTICMFIFLSGTMALIDTIIGNVIHLIKNSYFTLFGIIYGYDNLLANWLYLIVLYLLFCSLFYLSVLIINKVGKTTALLIGVGLGSIILLITSLFRFVFSAEIVHKIAEFMMKTMGFMSDGTINSTYPIITFLVIGIIFGICSYAIIRRTELK